MLKPSLSPQNYLPSNVAFAARSTLQQTQLVGSGNYSLDILTTGLMGCLNGLTSLRHESGLCKESFCLLEQAGIHVDEDIRPYKTAQEAFQLTRQIAAEGKLLFWTYPPDPELVAGKCNLVSVDLYKTLNSKACLQNWVPNEHLPERVILPQKAFETYTFATPVYVKSASDYPTASGFSVRVCENPSQLSLAKEWFASKREVIPEIVIEKAEDIVSSWCSSLIIGKDATHYLGSSEQLFSQPAKHAENIVDPGNPIPPQAIQVAILIGERARRAGFVGIAGFDIGLNRDGKLTVFDLNFRLNYSSTMLLYLDSILKNFRFPLVKTYRVSAKSDFKTFFKKASKAAAAGRFIPFRLVNGNLHPDSNGYHLIVGVVLGYEREELESYIARLTENLTG